MGAAWYVLQTKPRKENQVFSYLESQGIKLFYPTIQVKPVNPRASTIRPLFPRYMFVYANLDEIGFSTLHWVPNAIGLVCFGEHPAALSDQVVYAIQQRVREVQKRMTSGNLHPGDPVRITHGPLAGHEALFDMRLNGTERVQLLLNMVGRLVRVCVDTHAVEKC